MKTRETVALWVRMSLNEFPRKMIRRAMHSDEDSWEEITTPILGNTVHTYTKHSVATIIECNGKGNYTVEYADGSREIISRDEFIVEHKQELPTWPIIWNFKDSIYDDWISNGGVDILSECGFRVFHSDDFGFFFGVDDTNCDFLTRYWLPLYGATDREEAT